jgi:PAS domain S-box-containing protein
MARPLNSTEALCSLLTTDHGESCFEFLTDVQFWIKDSHGRYVRANRALLNNYGFRDMQTIIGLTDRELFPPHLAEQYQRDDQQVLSGREIRERIELVARIDHSTGWHVTNKLPLRARDGRIVGSAGITRDLQQGNISGKSLRRMEPVLAHIRAHYQLPLNKILLARLLGVSVRSLERGFMQAFGMSLLTYQRQLRMNQACHLLVIGEQPVTSIALHVGYGDHSHFTREFRKMFNITPRVYRMRWLKRPQLGIAAP